MWGMEVHVLCHQALFIYMHDTSIIHWTWDRFLCRSTEAKCDISSVNSARSASSLASLFPAILPLSVVLQPPINNFFKFIHHQYPKIHVLHCIYSWIKWRKKNGNTFWTASHLHCSLIRSSSSQHRGNSSLQPPPPWPLSGTNRLLSLRYCRHELSRWLSIFWPHSPGLISISTVIMVAAAW